MLPHMYHTFCFLSIAQVLTCELDSSSNNQVRYISCQAFFFVFFATKVQICLEWFPVWPCRWMPGPSPAAGSILSHTCLQGLPGLQRHHYFLGCFHCDPDPNFPLLIQCIPDGWISHHPHYQTCHV